MQATAKRSCVACSKSIEGTDPRRRYCSDRCRQRQHRQRFRRAAHRPLRLIEGSFEEPREPAEFDRALEVSLVESVIAAAEAGSWQAARWLLERRWPRRWGEP